MASGEETETSLPAHRIIVLGDEKSGKTSLIKSLTSGVMQLSHTPTDGVEITMWKPSHQPFIAAEILRGLTTSREDIIELWDTTGRQCCWPIHQAFFIPSAIYLILFNWLQPESVENSFKILQLIQQKVLGSQVLFICTRSAAKRSNLQINQVKDKMLERISTWEGKLSDVLVDQMNQLRECSSTNLVMAEVDRLEDILTNSLQIYPKILDIDMEQDEGLEVCMRTILSMLYATPMQVRMSSSDTPTESDEELMTVSSQLVRLSMQEKVVVPRNSPDLSSVNASVLHHLISQGHLLETHPQTVDEQLTDDLICVNPAKLANNSCLFHFDTLHKHLELEAYRFWPKDSGKDWPDPSLLVRALEEIPLSGVVREVLFPLLWQENDYTEEQIKLMLMVLVENDIIGEKKIDKKLADDLPMNELLLPNYPSLSVETFYILPIISLASNSAKPGVNWSDEIFPGDIHFGLIYSFPNTNIPIWFLNKLMTRCSRYTNSCTYKYQWNRGLLCKFKDELTMHIYYGDVEKKELFISCRGPFEENSDIVKLMWLAMKPAVQALSFTFSQYPGLVYQMDLEAKGSPLVTKVSKEFMRQTTSSFRFYFWSCLHLYLNGDVMKEKNGFQVKLDMIFAPIKEGVMSSDQSSWANSLYPNVDIEQLIQLPELITYSSEHNREGKAGSHKPLKVNWKSEIAEDIDIERKRYEDSHRPHMVSDKAMRRQLRRIARSLVTSVITSAVATILVQQGKISLKQESVAEILVGAVNAGCRGDTQAALHNMNKLMQVIPNEAKETSQQRKSRVCTIL